MTRLDVIGSDFQMIILSVLELYDPESNGKCRSSMSRPNRMTNSR